MHCRINYLPALAAVAVSIALSACGGGGGGGSTDNSTTPTIGAAEPEVTADIDEAVILASLDETALHTWQVRALTESGPGPWSAPLVITVLDDGMTPEVPTVTTQPRSGGNVSLEDELDPTLHTVSLDKEPVSRKTIASLNWAPVADSLGYEILINDASTGSPVLLDQITHDEVCSESVCQSSIEEPVIVEATPNTPPVATITRSQTPTLTAPMSVNLSAALSHDPDGFIERYTWGVEGIFIPPANRDSFSYTFASPGQYLVLLNVRDDQGAVTRTTRTVIVALPETENVDVDTPSPAPTIATATTDESEILESPSIAIIRALGLPANREVPARETATPAPTNPVAVDSTAKEPQVATANPLAVVPANPVTSNNQNAETEAEAEAEAEAEVEVETETEAEAEVETVAEVEERDQSAPESLQGAQQIGSTNTDTGLTVVAVTPAVPEEPDTVTTGTNSGESEANATENTPTEVPEEETSEPEPGLDAASPTAEQSESPYGAIEPFLPPEGDEALERWEALLELQAQDAIKWDIETRECS